MPPVHVNCTMVNMSYTDFEKLAGDESSGPASTNGDGSDDAGTIYYLETSTPHLYDIFVSDPRALLCRIYLVVEPTCTCPSAANTVLIARDQSFQENHLNTPLLLVQPLSHAEPHDLKSPQSFATHSSSSPSCPPLQPSPQPPPPSRKTPAAVSAASSMSSSIPISPMSY